LKSYDICNSVSLRRVLSKISNQWAALTFSLVMHDAIFLALFIEFRQQRLYMLMSSFFYSFFLVLNLAPTRRGAHVVPPVEGLNITSIPGPDLACKD